MASHFSDRTDDKAKSASSTDANYDNPTGPDGAASAPQTAGGTRGKGTRGLKVALIVIGILAALYVAGIAYFSSHFVPRTMAGGIDASWLTVEQLASKAREAAASHVSKVEGDGISFELSASDLGLEVDAENFAADAFKQQDAVAWPLTLARAAELSPKMAATVNEAQALESVRTAVAQHNETATAPTDASIVLDEQTKLFVIVPEQPGTQLSPEAIAKRVTTDASLLRTSTKLGEDELVKPSFTADGPAMAQALEKANALLAEHLTLKHGDKHIYDIDNKVSCQWVEFLYTPASAAQEAAANPQAAPADQAPQESHEGEEESQEEGNASDEEEEEQEPDPWDLPDTDPGIVFANEDGSTVGVRLSQKAIRWWSYLTLNDIVNGENEEQTWEVDSWETAGVIKQALNDGNVSEAQVVTTVVDERPPETEGHEERGRHIDVNLTTQYARFYDTDGKTVIWRSYVVSGQPDGRHNTPVGEFAIESKEYDITMVGADENGDGEPDYRTPCTFWMGFYLNSVGFHDSSDWRTYYGGDIYTWYGSHGCVNLSYESAEKLWNLCEVGDPVYVHY